MDSFEFNKIAGAVLAALLIAFGGGTLASIIGGEGHGGGEHAKPGWKLPVSESAGSGAAEPEKAKFDPGAVVALLKGASAENGEAMFKRCASCHTIDKGGKTIQGPNLYGIVGNHVAHLDGFNYSSAIKKLKGEWKNWSYEHLATYLHNPREAAPGNRMAFAGIPNNNDLADLILYLRSKADSPVPLP